MLGSRIGKLFLGAVTLLPLVYMAYFFWFVLSSFGSGRPAHDEQQFNHLFKLHMATMVLIFGLLIFYIIHLFRTSAIPNDKKALWAVILFFGNMLAMIVYWFLYIWRIQPSAIIMSKHEALLAAERIKDADRLNQAIAGMLETDHSPAIAATLSRLLLQGWHELHEDIVFGLGLMGDPGATNAILQAAQSRFEYLEQWGNLHEFQRKCAYALARIGTSESRSALEILAQSDDPHLREYAKEGLTHWSLPYRGSDPKV